MNSVKESFIYDPCSCLNIIKVVTETKLVIYHGEVVLMNPLAKLSNIEGLCVLCKHNITAVH